MGVDIRVENLNAWYGSTHTLQDINLHIPSNQATALIGPSGCGKSTFVRCLNRMHETNPIARAEGTVLMGGLDIYKDASPVEIRRRVGMVFQRPNPFPTMSIYDNVASGLKLNGFRNKRMLDEVVERSLSKPPSGRKSRTTSARSPALVSPADSSSASASPAPSPSIPKSCSWTSLPARSIPFPLLKSKISSSS